MNARGNALLRIVSVALLTAALAGCGSSSSSSSRDGGEGGDYDPTAVGFTIDTQAPGVTIVDRQTFEVVRSVELPDSAGLESGHFANLTADGKYLWICRDLGNRTDLKGTVDIYETDDFTLVKRWEVGCGVQSTWSGDGQWLFISSTKTSKINVFHVPTQEYLGEIPVSSAPHVGDVSPDGKTYWTTNAGGGHLLAFDISGLPATIPQTPVRDVNIGGNLHALRVHPNGKYVFVGSAISGTNIVDTSTGEVLKTVPGVPHNYAISLDRRYLASSELGARRLQFIDISELDKATPNFDHVHEIYELPSPNFGGSHQSWDTQTGKLWYTLYRNQGTPSGEGQLWIIDTAGLSAATPSVTVEKVIAVGLNPHSVVFPGRNAD